LSTFQRIFEDLDQDRSTPPPALAPARLFFDEPRSPFPVITTTNLDSEESNKVSSEQLIEKTTSRESEEKSYEEDLMSVTESYESSILSSDDHCQMNDMPKGTLQI